MEKVKTFEELIATAGKYLEDNFPQHDGNEWHINMCKTHLIDAVTWAYQSVLAKQKEAVKEKTDVKAD